MSERAIGTVTMQSDAWIELADKAGKWDELVRTFKAYRQCQTRPVEQIIRDKLRELLGETKCEN